MDLTQARSFLFPVRSGPLRMHPAHPVRHPVPVHRAVSMFLPQLPGRSSALRAAPRRSPGWCLARRGCSLGGPGGKEERRLAEERGVTFHTHVHSALPSLASRRVPGSAGAA